MRSRMFMWITHASPSKSFSRQQPAAVAAAKVCITIQPVTHRTIYRHHRYPIQPNRMAPDVCLWCPPPPSTGNSHYRHMCQS